MMYATSEQRSILFSAVARFDHGDSVYDMLAGIANGFGLPAATLLLMPSRTDSSLADLVLETTIGIDFWRGVDAVQGLRKCRLFCAARNSIVPVTWSIEEMQRQRDLTADGDLPIIPHYKEFGISRGIIFPLTSLDGIRHALRFDGNRGPITQAETNDLAMLAAHVMQVHDRDRHPELNTSMLTDREIEVIRWSATGKTSLEIAAIMSLSDHTVNAYMNNALRKMKCVNRTQLVAKALRMRIIS